MRRAFAAIPIATATSLAAAPLDFQRYSAVTMPCAEIEPAYPASAIAAALRSELEALRVDCSQPGWDGYGAEPVSLEAYQAALRFIRSLPVGTPQPEIGADPDGCVSFEWRKSARCTLLVSIRPGYALDYAALIGTAKVHGSEPFFGELPDAVLSQIRRVMAA